LEPYYKLFNSGIDGIRIEDPNEIIIFDDKEWINKFIKAENNNEKESFKLLKDENNKYRIFHSNMYYIYIVSNFILYAKL
jgi:hypothetical protein